MKSPTTLRWWAAAILAPLVLLPLSRQARAQDPFAGPDAAPGAAAAPPPAAAPPAPAPAAAPEDAGLVERLPPSAYPEWKTRGIPGGSLAFSGNMHGMPWPYYPRTGIGVSGYAWVDTGYETVDRGQVSQPGIKYLVSQGRAVLRLTPTYSAGTFYLQGQAELVANKDQTLAQPNVADVDDLWVRIGQWKQWDLQLGRFEAFEVYHFGMGMDLNTLERDGAVDQVRAPPDVYGLKTVTYRQNGIGNVAFHVYPSSALRFEVLGQFGFDAATSIDTVGARPAVVFDLGWLKLKGEGDLRKQFPVFSNSKESRFQRGGAAAAQFVFDPFVEFGFNFAYGLTDHYNPLNTTDPNATMGDFDTAGSTTDLDFGGFVNFRPIRGLVVGAGGNLNTQTDQQDGKFTHLQTFGAVQMEVLQHLYVKLVGAYAQAHIAPGGVASWDNTMISGRVRLMYLF
jgi:hypothetical protein